MRPRSAGTVLEVVHIQITSHFIHDQSEPPQWVQSLCTWLEKVESGCAFFGIGPRMSGCGYSSAES